MTAMATATTSRPPVDLYEADFHAWCMQQATLLRQRSRPGVNDGLDYENLAEEIESMGRSDRRSIKSHMRVLLCHLLKWRHQRARRTRSWEDSIFNARTAIADLLKDSPSLQSYARDVIAEAYPLAVRDASSLTRKAKLAFPATCPFSEAEILDSDFLPPAFDVKT